MAHIKVTVDGFTYEGRWLSNGTGGLHVNGPLEYKRPTRGFYSADAGWDDDAGPTGRPTERHKRWWRAAHELLDRFNIARGVTD